MVLLTLVAAISLAAEPVRVAAPGFSSHGLEEKAGDFYADQVSQQLSFHGLKVITRSEVSALLGHERQRELLGCQDDSGSCAVELAGALGTDALLLGEAAKVGDKFRISVRIVSSKNGDKLSSAVVTASSEDAVLEAFGLVAPRIAKETIAKVRKEPVPAEAAGVTTQRTGTKRFFWIPAAVGGVALAGGAVSYFQAKSRFDELRSGTVLIEPRPSQLRNEGQSWQTLSMAGFGVGAAAFATAAGLVLFGSESVVEAGVAFGPAGASVGIAGSF